MPEFTLYCAGDGGQRRGQLEERKPCRKSAGEGRDTEKEHKKQNHRENLNLC